MFNALLDKTVKHRWFHISGWVIGALGLVLAVVFYYRSIEERQLIFTEGASRSTLIQKTRPSGISVIYKGKPIDGEDVVAIQVSVWNEGRLSVKPENLLLPFTMRMDGARILDVSVSQSTRPFVEPVITVDPDDPTLIHIAFRILEHRDGFTFQVVYAGPEASSLRASGAVEGQGPIHRLSTSQRDTSKSIGSRIADVLSMIIMMVVGLLGGYQALRAGISRLWSKVRVARGWRIAAQVLGGVLQLLLGVVLLLIGVASVIYLVFSWTAPVPPL